MQVLYHFRFSPTVWVVDAMTLINFGADSQTLLKGGHCQALVPVYFASSSHGKNDRRADYGVDGPRSESALHQGQLIDSGVSSNIHYRQWGQF